MLTCLLKCPCLCYVLVTVFFAYSYWKDSRAPLSFQRFHPFHMAGVPKPNTETHHLQEVGFYVLISCLISNPLLWYLVLTAQLKHREYLCLRGRYWWQFIEKLIWWTHLEKKGGERWEERFICVVLYIYNFRLDD